MTRIDFRPLDVTDLHRMHRWLNDGPVLQWYARRRKTFVEVAAHYGRMISGQEPTRAFLALFDGEPAGFCKTYRIDSYPEYYAQTGAGPTWAGLDYLIGEAKWRGRKLAPRMIERFVESIVFHSPGIDTCVSGPDPDNVISIRTLRSAGFRFLHEVEVRPGERECLMVRKAPHPVPVARGQVY